MRRKSPEQHERVARIRAARRALEGFPAGKRKGPEWEAANRRVTEAELAIARPRRKQ